MKKVNPLAKWWCIVLITTSVIGLASIVFACTIPVFRYALDYWPPDTYEVVVFHEGTFSPEAQTAFSRLQGAAKHEEQPANIHVRTQNLAESPGGAAKIPVTSEGSGMTVKYPLNSRTYGEVWSGAFTAETVEMILDSPARREIVCRLLNEEVGVWVLLESGNQQKDNQAAQLLNAQLLEMSMSLKVARPDENGAPDSQNGEGVKFSTIRLSRNDPAENIFVSMLLGTEWDLETAKSPIAFPIFGRGRALYALIGDGINAENIRAACEFLIGWCSCQVKDLNPGVDLLMSASWGGTIREDSEVYQNTLSMLGLAETTVPDVENESPMRRNIVIGVLILTLMAAFGGAGVVIWRVRRSGN